MPIPHVYLPVRPQDFTIKPFKTHKRYVVTPTDYSSSGYTVHEGVYTSLKTPVSSSKALNDPTNSFDGSYQHIIWQSINHRYYKYAYDPVATFEHPNKRYTYKNLFLSCSILSTPYHDMGEGIKPGSVEIIKGDISIRDDGNGNLYDVMYITSSYPPRYNVVAYWGFNETYKAFKYGTGTKGKQLVNYISHLYEPIEKSLAKNVNFNLGVTNNSNQNTGLEARFNGSTSNISTHHRPELNFDQTEDFSIGFFIRAPLSQSNIGGSVNSIISKKGTIRKRVFGKLPKLSPNDLLIPTPHISQSIVNESTNVYPYHFDIYNETNANSGKIRFRRSDGIKVVELTSTGSITGDYQYVSVTKSGSLLSLYVNGQLHETGSDVGSNPSNEHMLIFGSENIDYNGAFSGSLDEVRIYDKALSTTEIETLLETTTGSLYQTSVVGNVFYKTGIINISSFQPRYGRFFNTGTWQVIYRNTHTIYQNECLVRIKAGSANVTQNPTALKSANSDLFMDEVTGSLLKPYLTTIGLYGPDGSLLAIGKLGQPVQIRDDVDMNIVVRWDY